MLGVRPSTDRSLAEPFALLRGLTVLEIVSHRHATWLALRDGVDVGEYDHVRAAAAVYERVRTAYRDALRGDWRRCELLQRQMRKAGLPASSCFGATSPLSRWREVWEHARICTGGATLVQHLLPDQPLTPMTPADGLAARRLCPRTECAPPDALPPTTVQVYVAARSDGFSFGLTFVQGGDVEYDLAAQHEADAAGRVPSDARTPTAASLFAAIAALDVLAADGPRPVVLRFADEGAGAIACGAWQPSSDRRLQAALETRLRAARQRLGHPVWLAGFRSDCLMPWGERATAAASYGGSHGHWGRLPPTLATADPVAPATPPWWDDDTDHNCPVCLDAMASPWPSPDAKSRAPRGRWSCDQHANHAVCRSCDAHVQHSANDKCPLCRAARRVHMAP